MTETICQIELNTQKRIGAKQKNGDRDGNVLYKLMINALYGKLWKT